MPVTAKLSKAFYDRLGDALANELVEWFNAVDAANSADLRELNELNFSRFTARMDERFAASDAKWETRFAASDAKWETRFAELELRIERRLGEQTRSMYLAWAVMLAAVAGLYVK